MLATMLSTEVAMTDASDSIFLFEQYSFEKQISYFILLGLIGGIFWISNNDITDASDEINPTIAVFPLLAFIVAYILGEYGGHYIMTLFLLGLGFLYVRKGIEKKDSIKVGLGVTIFIYTLIYKIIVAWGEEWAEDFIQEKNSTGLIIILFGIMFLGAIVYVRSQWNVTGLPSDNSISNDDVLDNLEDASLKDTPTED
jgi:hypothetical protein